MALCAGASLLMPLAAAAATPGVVTGSATAAAQQSGHTDGVDTGRGCVFNGFMYDPAGGIAAGPHCFTTPDESTLAPLAVVDESKTLQDLAATQAWSPLDPDHYLGAGSAFTRGIPADAGYAANSDQVAGFVANSLAPIYLPDQFDPWLRTAYSAGDGVGANDNIPIYTVDSSNPHQEFVTVTSTDRRITTFPKLEELTTGRIPLPSWAKPSDGGDHALAVYDTGTGILRAYFNLSKAEDGSWAAAASAYLYADQVTHTLGEDNFWGGYLQGSSSVVGVANELTQIGAAELKAGEIGHMVSVTFPNYTQGVASFPAKQTDGSLAAGTYPNAPAAGQVFTFPADFDVEKYVAENGIKPGTAAVMRAVQKYGGIVSDKNHWCMSFNLESPYGMGDGVNPYKTDPELASAVAGLSDINTFPWAQTAWMPVNWADTGADPGDPGTGETDPGTGETDPGSGETGTGETDPDSSETDPGSGETGTGETDPDSSETDPDSGETGTGETDPDSSETDPDSGETGTGETDPDSGETDPGSGGTGSGGTGSGGTGSGETGTGETGSGETGTGETDPGSSETDPGSSETGTGETDPGSDRPDHASTGGSVKRHGLGELIRNAIATLTTLLFGHR